MAFFRARAMSVGCQRAGIQPVAAQCSTVLWRRPSSWASALCPPKRRITSWAELNAPAAMLATITSFSLGCNRASGFGQETRRSHTDLMASYSVNDRALAHARRLIETRQYTLDSDWGEVQPRADDENTFLKGHTWDEYGEWHLGL